MLRGSVIAFILGWILWFWIDKNPHTLGHVPPPMEQQLSANFQVAIDLVKAQIRVAAGEPLWFRQEDVPQRGCAIECRINAEDPEKNFRPTPGTITSWFPPGGFGVRFDSHAHQGYVVSHYYDSIIGKLLVQQPTREEAIAGMQRALRELRIEGVKTTIPVHKKILDHPAFQNAQGDTTFIERTWP